EEIAQTLTLYNKAVSTSAGYECYISVNGNNFSHIVNPITSKLVPAQGSVTVVADEAVWADCFSTAIYVDNNLAKSLTMIQTYIVE
ncbi:unnamed protein product, partial [marine sediment metagenome]